jgi:hypothetical protein
MLQFAPNLFTAVNLAPNLFTAVKLELLRRM